MAESNDDIPIPSGLPPKLDNGAVRKALSEIKKAQANQAIAEAQRVGASKLTAKLVAFFGATITAAAIGSFIWVLDVQSQNQAQTTAIKQLNKGGPREHGHQGIEAIHTEDRAEDMRRVDAVETAQKSLGERLDRRDAAMSQRLDDIMREIRSSNRRQRTWGGD